MGDKTDDITENFTANHNYKFTIGKYTGHTFSQAFSDAEFIKECNEMCKREFGKTTTPLEFQKFKDYAVERCRKENKICFGKHIGLDPKFVYEREMELKKDFNKTYAAYCLKLLKEHENYGTAISNDMKKLATTYSTDIEKWKKH